MNILIPFPTFAPHGGTRIVIALANGFAKLGHKVTLVIWRNQSERSYWKIDPRVEILSSIKYLTTNYTILITSPHSIHYADGSGLNKTFLHLQMMEHMFNPSDTDFYSKCVKMYQHSAPMFSISKWNMEMLKSEFGRAGETIYIGNGVDFEDFPIITNPSRDPKPTILVEGWDAYNECKDVERYGPRIARELKKEGINILSYGQVLPRDYKDVPDEFYFKPSLKLLNRLYERSWLLLKCSRYDARSCSPVEAMTKGTLTVRLITEGDDDLIDGYNSLRFDYETADLDQIKSEILNLISNFQTGHPEIQAFRPLQHVQQECNWDKWIKIMGERMMQ